MARRRAYYSNRVNEELAKENTVAPAGLALRNMDEEGLTSATNAQGPGAPLGGIRQITEIYPGE